jgi:hypothetical protein
VRTSRFWSSWHRWLAHRSYESKVASSRLAGDIFCCRMWQLPCFLTTRLCAAMETVAALPPRGLPGPSPTHIGLLHLNKDKVPVQMVVPQRATASVQLSAKLVEQWAAADGVTVLPQNEVVPDDAPVRAVVFFDGSAAAQAWHPQESTVVDYILVFLDDVHTDSSEAYHLDAIRLLAGAAAVWVLDVPVFIHLLRRYSVPQDRVAVVPSLALGSLLGKLT